MSGSPKEFKGPLYIAVVFLIIVALILAIPYLWTRLSGLNL
jgi:hypothetical protein